MDTVTVLLFLNLVLGFLALIGVLVVWKKIPTENRPKDEETLRNIVFTGSDRIEMVFREETRIMRGEAEERGRMLREEVGVNIRTFGDSIFKRVEEMGSASEERFSKFGESQETRANALQQKVGENLNAVRVELEKQLGQFRKDNTESGQALRQENGKQAKDLQDLISLNLARSSQEFRENAQMLTKAQKDGLEGLSDKVRIMTESNEKRQDTLREAVELRLEKLREENAKKLDEMRQTVDEKLQGTLEKRLGESFQVVSDRLEKVHQGLGEMQTLATGVGDLKKALTNVRVRGGWGEVQLGALLEQMLSPDQYEKNVRIKKETQEAVEYAIRLLGPGDEKSHVLLPVDAKFPQEDYDRLISAFESGKTEDVEQAGRQLELRIKAESKRISEKYIDPPQTTDFAILFLPTEGLFAEILRRPGLANEIQSKHRVVLTGPTTLGALLNSLQMGFRTLAIQKRSSEVWKVLGEAKAEFVKYGSVWDKLKKQIDTVANTVDDAGTRTRAIERKLRDVELLAPVENVMPLVTVSMDSEDEITK